MPAGKPLAVCVKTVVGRVPERVRVSPKAGVSVDAGVSIGARISVDAGVSIGARICTISVIGGARISIALPI